MAMRRRWRVFVFPLALYCVSAGFAGYFVWHAFNGERGLKAKAELRQKITTLNGEIAAAAVERDAWRRRVALLRTGDIDRDILDEQARLVLGRVDRNDAVVFLDAKSR